MNYTEFYNTFDKKLYTKKVFKNKHGERFYVIKTRTLPEVYFITGEEYDWELTRLFNEDFDIYSSDEIREIGKCLQELNS